MPKTRSFPFPIQGIKKPNCRITSSYSAIRSSFVRRKILQYATCQTSLSTHPSHREGQTNLSESKPLAIVFLRIFRNAQNREIPNIHAVNPTPGPSSHLHPTLNNVPAHAKKSSEFRSGTPFHHFPRTPRGFPGTK